MASRVIAQRLIPRYVWKATLGPAVCISRSHRIARQYATAAPFNRGTLPTVLQQHVDAQPIPPTEMFVERHIGPAPTDVDAMLKALDPPVKSLEDFIDQSLPANIRSAEPLTLSSSETDTYDVENGLSESDTLRMLENWAQANALKPCYIGRGYYGTITPPPIQRNVLESPAWYTSYTPYQPEISQGRLESLLNFQTMVTDLTGMTIANASVLDEATAAAEAMTMCMNTLPASRLKQSNKHFVVSDKCHPQTIAVLESRAHGFGIKIVVGDLLANDLELVRNQGKDLMGVLAQYPDTTGGVHDFTKLAEVIHKNQATFAVATDLLALTMLKPPGEFGADIAFGSAQRFGVPMGFGGPHAAFFACAEKHKRKIPGRLIGVSKDRLGNAAMRLALQTREQHIRREKATSNICTAQALLANMASLYAVYHGPKGLRAIANKVWRMAAIAQAALVRRGWTVVTDGRGQDGHVLFDTIVLRRPDDFTIPSAQDAQMEWLQVDQDHVSLSFGEDIRNTQLEALLVALGVSDKDAQAAVSQQGTIKANWEDVIPESVRRTSEFMTHPVFNTHHSETELMRYIYQLQSKDLSLVHSMIPLGSCTMKLNAATEMMPVSFATYSRLHPFVDASKSTGYLQMIETLSQWLTRITGMDDVSLQPNSGAQGEFAGLRAIKKFHETSGEKGKKRNICLIPVSAHGTNPASAAMSGMKVVPIKCDMKTGNLDVVDLEEKCKKHSDELAAIMITYPSTFGVFEPEVKRVCEMVHQYGGQVYMDGANLNAQIGLCSPGGIGADVCHLNLHKTFCIPHGGGGPGVGPIGVKQHLAKHLPSHPEYDPHSDVSERSGNAIAPVSAAPYGSASILPISLAYIAMMGSIGLTYQTKVALLNANYMMARLKDHYPIVYTNAQGRCAHEFILDIRGFKETCGIEAIDVAKRLQDYGFHAPTMSWPVANTLMIEPTESESKEELDRYCDALIEIRKEIKAIEDGKAPKEGNVLKMAPHPQADLITDAWDRPYTRQQAAYPLPWLREKKFWPSVARIDDAYGDTNLFCTCTPVEGFEKEGLTGHQAPMPT